MEPPLDEAKTKALIQAVLVEMLQKKRGTFYELILEALEEVGLANAIEAGQQNEFVPEKRIFEILEANA